MATKCVILGGTRATEAARYLTTSNVPTEAFSPRDLAGYVPVCVGSRDLVVIALFFSEIGADHCANLVAKMRQTVNAAVRIHVLREGEEAAEPSEDSLKGAGASEVSFDSDMSAITAAGLLKRRWFPIKKLPAPSRQQGLLARADRLSAEMAAVPQSIPPERRVIIGRGAGEPSPTADTGTVKHLQSSRKELDMKRRERGRNTIKLFAAAILARADPKGFVSREATKEAMAKVKGVAVDKIDVQSVYQSVHFLKSQKALEKAPGGYAVNRDVLRKLSGETSSPSPRGKEAPAKTLKAEKSEPKQRRGRKPRGQSLVQVTAETLQALARIAKKYRGLRKEFLLAKKARDVAAANFQIAETTYAAVSSKRSALLASVGLENLASDEMAGALDQLLAPQNTR